MAGGRKLLENRKPPQAYLAVQREERNNATTVYDIELFGHRLEVLELGTAARHDVGADAQVTLPREMLWTYRDQGPAFDA